MRTVLLIDDDAQFRNFVAEYLQEHGWHTLQAADGDEGIQLAKSHQPDAILCDLLMPRCNGFLVCEQLRKSESLRATRILVMSGRDFESDRLTATRAGADAYLTKPLNLPQLLTLLPHGGPPSTPVIPSPPTQTHSPAPSSTPTRVTFWGVRGSIPAPGPATVRYGGNTSCIEIRADSQLIILDAGTGIRPLGQRLLKEFAHQPLEITLLLTHTHWDHIQGLPFFLPLLPHQSHLRILGFEGARHGLDNLLTSQMESPFFPVGMRDLSGNIRIEELKDLHFQIGPVRVEAAFANHPGICVGYRLYTSAGSVAFFPDNEPHLGRERWPQAGGPALDHARREHQKIVHFLQDTDLLIMDTQYDCDEYLQHRGWGHGCLDDVVALALEANIKQLFLFHHDPDHDDAKIEQMLDYARAIVHRAGANLRIEAATEGALVELASPKPSTAL